METKEICDEIKDLIQIALQDFLDLIVKDKWQDKLYLKAKNAVNNNIRRTKYKNVYITLDKMDDKSKFKTKDMDTTLIVEVTYYDDLGNKDQKNKTDRFVKITPKTQIAIYNLSQARNSLSHKSGNESSKKLYKNGLVALQHLSDFIEIVDCYELSIDELKRNTFKKKFEKPIEKLNDLLEVAHTQIKLTEKIQNDIQHISESSNPDQAWLTISDPYYRNWKPPMGEEEYITFITEAAKAGIVQAYPSAADYYFTVKDYDMAEKYLSYLYQNRKNKRYNKDSMLLLANIYLNKLSEHTGEDKAIVEMLLADGYIIKKSDDGKSYHFVYKIDKNVASVEEAFSHANTSMHEAIRILNEGKSNSKDSELRKDNKKTIDSSSYKQYRKSDLTVGEVSGSKKMRLGRVHKKKPSPNSTTEQQPDTQTTEKLSESKIMRLGRVHKKKPNPDSTTEQLDTQTAKKTSDSKK